MFLMAKISKNIHFKSLKNEKYGHLDFLLIF